ncbi:hypothetical protein BaRGS_00021718, partial [Batillaria attramentaria]
NLNCTWLLEAPNDDHYIVLESVKLDLEAPEDDVCKYDYVSIYDGPSTSSTMMGERLCGETSFSNRSTGRQMTVVLVSDAAEEKTGFKFKYFAFNTNPTTGITEKDPVIVVGKTTDSPDQIERLNTGALIGGVLGGVCFVIIMGILCGRCVGDNGPRQPPEHRPAAFYHSHAPPSTDTSAVSRAVHMVQNNNAVFMVHHATGGAVSPSHLSSVSSGVNGVTNMAFSSSGDQLNASLTSSYGFPGPPVGIPPPAYTDSMLATHPPRIAPSPRHQATLQSEDGGETAASDVVEHGRSNDATDGEGVTDRDVTVRDGLVGRDDVTGGEGVRNREVVVRDGLVGSYAATNGEGGVDSGVTARQDMASGDEIVTNDTGVTNSDNVTTERDGMVGRGVVSDDVDVTARDGVRESDCTTNSADVRDGAGATSSDDVTDRDTVTHPGDATIGTDTNPNSATGRDTVGDVTNPGGLPVLAALVSSSGGPAMAHAFSASPQSATSREGDASVGPTAAAADKAEQEPVEAPTEAPSVPVIVVTGPHEHGDPNPLASPPRSAAAPEDLSPLQDSPRESEALHSDHEANPGDTVRVASEAVAQNSPTPSPSPPSEGNVDCLQDEPTE